MKHLSKLLIIATLLTCSSCAVSQRTTECEYEGQKTVSKVWSVDQSGNERY